MSEAQAIITKLIMSRVSPELGTAIELAAKIVGELEKRGLLK